MFRSVGAYSEGKVPEKWTKEKQLRGRKPARGAYSEEKGAPKVEKKRNCVEEQTPADL